MSKVMSIYPCILSLVIASATLATAEYDHTVYQTQKALKERGYDLGDPDGLWGKKTEAAIRRFQKDRSIPITGKLDNETKENLGLQVSPTSTSEPQANPTSSSAARIAQGKTSTPSPASTSVSQANTKSLVCVARGGFTMHFTVDTTNNVVVLDDTGQRARNVNIDKTSISFVLDLEKGAYLHVISRSNGNMTVQAPNGNLITGHK